MKSSRFNIMTARWVGVRISNDMPTYQRAELHHKAGMRWIAVAVAIVLVSSALRIVGAVIT